ncbi:D-hexose-6-phosphate mutarotase [Chitinimonas taiwanensis]|uniref:D-hexose-6-phosphate mutarotase n=1 Tax=Chitinimonas taiwanensis TaxID=240412 RepID=UPI0035AF2D9D
MSLIELVSAHGRARISPQGAQVLDAELDGRPLLWLSPLADFTPGKAVRGGVPLCFPWFGKHPQGLPAHGFARNQRWTVLEQSASQVRLALEDNAETRALWPHAFRLELTLQLDQALDFTFRVENRDALPIQFSYALHSYFAVTDLHGSLVQGLDGCLRRELAHVTMPQPGAVRLVEPIDAVFELAPAVLQLQEGPRQVLIEAESMRSAVVWNPGPAAEAVADIGVHWPEYVCVERGNIGAAAITLAAGEVHQASMRLSQLPGTAK